MYSTDPTSPQRALCYFLDPIASNKLAYVQFPQRFQGLNKSDIYGGEMKHLFKMNPYGMDGFGGPNYLGSNTFLARRALFDSSLESESGRNLLEPEKVLEMATEAAACKTMRQGQNGAKLYCFFSHTIYYSCINCLSRFYTYTAILKLYVFFFFGKCEIVF